MDHGGQLKGGRYTVDLGPIDVSRPGEYSYVLNGLPEAEFVIGLELVAAAPGRDHRPDQRAEVWLELKEAGGRTVVTEVGSLEAWIWSYGAGDTKSFLYRRGVNRPVFPGGSIT